MRIFLAVTSLLISNVQSFGQLNFGPALHSLSEIKNRCQLNKLYGTDAINDYALLSTSISSMGCFVCDVHYDTISTILEKSWNSGKAGAVASAAQVLTFMWLRTVMNYQYRYGTTTNEAFKTLFSQGGILRFYQGLPFAILQGPLSRFGDVASNQLLLTLLDATELHLPIAIRTGLGSIVAGGWRILLMPIDTAKTCLQVEGENGFKTLKRKVSINGLSEFYVGAIAASVATIVGHYPWFLTYNLLSASLPSPETSIIIVHDIIINTINSQQTLPIANDILSQVDRLILQIDVRFLVVLRSAFIGLCASCTSDICSNSLRVLKTTRQTLGTFNRDDLENSETNATTSRFIPSVIQDYIVIGKSIIQQDGWSGLFGRGLAVRLLTNGLQGMFFSVLFKYFQNQK